MTKKYLLKNLLFGFLSWLIPFAASCLFYKPEGELAISHDLFKSIMIVVGSVSGCYLLFRYFRSVNSDFMTHGFIVGISWLLINIVLDTIILIPLMKVNFSTYFMSIGLGYTVLPVMSVTIGCLLQRKTSR